MEIYMPKVDDAINAENGSWSFAANDPLILSNHMRKSIPDYDQGHSLILEISEFFVKQESIIYDIGCSNGELTHQLAKKYQGKKVQIIGVDCEENFIKAAKGHSQTNRNLTFETENAIDYKYKTCDLVILYYTLQFIQIDKRENLLLSLYKSLKKGGGLLLFEKTRQDNPRANDILNQLYTDFKLNNGYTGNEIVAKARSLKGVLEPLSTEQNLELLEQTGFYHSTIIHKTLCFDGILAIK